jgi:hypothetical protein
MLSEIGFPPLFLAIRKDGVVVCLHITRDHQLNDLFYETRFNSKWQLAPLVCVRSMCEYDVRRNAFLVHKMVTFSLSAV